MKEGNLLYRKHIGETVILKSKVISALTGIKGNKIAEPDWNLQEMLNNSDTD